jgi:tRNA-dihydrouridine synthase A
LSPKENRTVPPLRHAEVHRLKRELPHLAVEINGGILDLAAAREHLAAGVDAVMIGRAAYDDPYLLAAADSDLFGDAAEPPSRRQAIERLLPYVEAQLARGVPLKRLTRHVLGLFAGRPGARAWKRHLAEHAHRDGAGPEVLLAALGKVPGEVLDERPGVVGDAQHLRRSA